MFLSTVIPLASLFVSGVWAQFEMAQCKTGFEWNRNSQGQDACLIGSKLDAACRGLVLYNYPPLNSSQYYLPPRKDHPGDMTCDCNTVMYSLYMECALCQGGQIYSWTSWIAACESVYVTQYPSTIPQGTPIPRWAFFNVTLSTGQTYNESNAISIGRNPEETPSPLLTTSAGSGTGSLEGPTSTRQPTSTPIVPPNGGTNVGAIVGGVVGSIVPLMILGVVAYFYMRHRRQQEAKKQQQQPQQPMYSPDGLDPYQQHRPSMYGAPVTSPLYNPSDPSTFPPQSPQNSVTYTTPAYNVRGAYSGAPEV